MICPTCVQSVVSQQMTKKIFIFPWKDYLAKCRPLMSRTIHIMAKVVDVLPYRSWHKMHHHIKPNLFVSSSIKITFEHATFDHCCSVILHMSKQHLITSANDQGRNYEKNPHILVFILPPLFDSNPFIWTCLSHGSIW